MTNPTPTPSADIHAAEKTPRAGDAILHKPSGETWAVAGVYENGDILCAGWPLSLARVGEYEVTHRCSDAEHERMLRDCARLGDARGSLAKQALGIIPASDSSAEQLAALQSEIARLRADIATATANAAKAQDTINGQARELEGLREKMKQRQDRNVFKPHWPDGLEGGVGYGVMCDDKGRNGGSWIRVLIAQDGDVHVAMQDWEEIPEGQPSPFPSIRVRTMAGGGRNDRTRQALLWLAQAIRLDNADKGLDVDGTRAAAEAALSPAKQGGGKDE